MKPAAVRNAGTPLVEVVLVVIAVTAAQTVAAMGTSMLPVIAPKLAESLRIDPAWIGMQVSLVYGAGAFSALYAGGIVTRLGACRTMQTALLATACGAAIATLPALPAIAVASLLIGTAIGLINSPAAQLLLRFSPPGQLNLIFSIKQTGVPLGFTLAALIGPVVTLTFGWQWSLVLLGVLAMTIGAALQRGRTAWDGDRIAQAPLLQSPLAGLRAVWSLPELRYLVLTGAAFSAIQVSISAFAVTMLVGEVGHGLIFAGLMMSLLTFSGVSARLVFGWIADRVHAGLVLLAVMGVGMIASCAMLGRLDATWSLGATTVLFIVLGMAVIGWNGIVHAEVARRSPAGTVSLTASGVTTLMYAANAVMPTLAALLYRALGKYSLMFAALSVCACAGLWFLAACARARGHTAPPPP